ncbi:MAG TPA: NAD(P)/FAD-dependent oxidoreductase [Methanomicrobiales archaeon]|nr:NAD(P)/FAD-dependent oxidoreductase [Methanomicrobiales archaeon]
MGKIPDGAILQRDGKTWAVITRTPAGLISPGHLEKVAAVARKHGVPTLKITSGQRIALVGIPEEQLGGVFRDLGPEADSTGGPCLHYVRACPGTETCRFGVQDSMGLAAALEERFRGRTFPSKLKMGISGCPRCCGESHTRDIGILGTNRGWTVIFGGNGGTRPRIGNVIARNLSRDDALDLVERLLGFWESHANPKERTARFMERVGMDTLRSELLSLIPYISLEQVK